MDWSLLFHKWFGPPEALGKILILVGALVVLRVVLTVSWLRAPREALIGFGSLVSGSPRDDVFGWLKEVIDSGLLALGLVFLIIRPFIVQAFFIPSGSMEPTLYGSTPPMPGHANDRILVSKFIYALRPPQRQDIIVFRAPIEASWDAEGKDFIKRLIGLPGDRVAIRNGTVYINGEPLDEPYLPPSKRPLYDYPEVVVPEGRYFVLGDNRNESNDSHHWGFLPQNYVIGKALCIFWPINRWRILK